MKKITVRKSVLTICFLAFSFCASANDTITFTWQAGTTNKTFTVLATSGETFTVYWGDETDDIYTGTGNLSVNPSHVYTAAGTYTVNIVANSASCRFTYLFCSNTSIRSLNVSKSTALETLYCNTNSLNSLDVSKNTALRRLECAFNSISSLNVSNNTVLAWLDCSSNPISSLDVTNNTALKELECFSNQLITLDLSKNTALEKLSCSNNSLSSLDVSKNTALTWLNCFSNVLSSLDLSNNTALTWLQCYNNRLSLSDLFVASETMYNQFSKRLGTQTLMPQTVSTEETLFSEQSMFNGIYTDYIVTKNGNPAPTSDYTISNGTITFHNLGIYTITMTNNAIVSHTDYPAKVIADINVNNVNAIEAIQVASIKIYPNPVKDELKIESGDLTIKKIDFLDITGKIVGNSSNVSALSQGIYFVRLETDKGIITEKFVKE